MRDANIDARSRPQHTLASAVRVVRMPSNDLGRLTQAFVSKVSLSVDISCQLAGNLGGFLCEIPKRFGVNEALDAAVEVLVVTYSRFCAGSYRLDTEVLAKHSRILNVLRESLNDPVKAHSSETLCFVMLSSICEVRVY